MFLSLKHAYKMVIIQVQRLNPFTRNVRPGFAKAPLDWTSALDKEVGFLKSQACCTWQTTSFSTPGLFGFDWNPLSNTTCASACCTSLARQVVFYGMVIEQFLKGVRKLSVLVPETRPLGHPFCETYLHIKSYKHMQRFMVASPPQSIVAAMWKHPRSQEQRVAILQEVRLRWVGTGRWSTELVNHIFTWAQDVAGSKGNSFSMNS